MIVNDATQLLASGATQAEAVAFLNEWLAVDVATVPTTAGEIAALQWDGERLFQAAKLGTEMQYQHLVFEEFARKIQPQIDVFLGPGRVRYHDRCGDRGRVRAHGLPLRPLDAARRDRPALDPISCRASIGLIDAFLNPLAFDQNDTLTRG